ncbi:hypothetical protein BJY01DRAFT_256198 [Aspergillus pseudoustus]|uniref:Uncharacterized protein n=1 Tax=Aspergillus pseudoustus TaxID=1810923 RepID=A0ABR4ID75_9EURO
MVLNEFLHELEHPTPLRRTFNGSEARHLIPSLDVVLVMPAVREPKLSVRADELLATYTEGQSSISLPIPPGKATLPPRNTRRCEVQIPADDDINPGVCDRQDGCAQQPNQPGYTLNLLSRLSTYANILVRTIQPMYRQSWSVSESDVLFVRVPLVEKATAMFQAAAAVALAGENGWEDEGMPAPAPSELYISSLGIHHGRMKQRYGAVGVRRVAVMVHTLSQQLMVHVWSWTVGCLTCGGHFQGGEPRSNRRGGLLGGFEGQSG